MGRSQAKRALRAYGSGTSVTLVAPDMAPDFKFNHWLLDGTPVSPPPGAPERQIVVTMTGAHTVVPVASISK